MDMQMTDGPEGRDRVDVAGCTLPTAEQPLRLAEFDDLFATSLRTVDRIGDTRATLTLTGDGGLTDRIQDLDDAESECCSFFTFQVVPAAPGQVTLGIEVPATYSEVLAALVDRAESALGGVA